MLINLSVNAKNKENVIGNVSEYNDDTTHQNRIILEFVINKWKDTN